MRPTGAPEPKRLLNYAARDIHLETLIRPALERGAVVVCDRFLDSFNACLSGISRAASTSRFSPARARTGGDRADAADLTLVLDIDPRATESPEPLRAAGRPRRIAWRRGRLPSTKRCGGRFSPSPRPNRNGAGVIDASRDADTVEADVWRMCGRSSRARDGDTGAQGRNGFGSTETEDHPRLRETLTATRRPSG